MRTYRVPTFFYVDAENIDAAERLVAQELNSVPVQGLIGDAIGSPEILPGQARKYTPLPPGDVVAVARQAAAQAHDAHEDAANGYAAALSRIAALLVRGQMPTASVLVFVKDEETVSAATTIEIVSVRDADGAALGELDWPTTQEVCWLIRTAYDSADGFYPVADQDTYDTESVGGEWQDRNLLELHIDDLIGEFA